MTILIIIALITATILLWQEVSALKRRVAVLEMGELWAEPTIETSEPAAAPSPPLPPRRRPGSNWEGQHGDVPPSAAIVPQLGPGLRRGGDEEPIAVATPTPPPFTFEDIFGRRLPIWAGGVTLAVAGFLIVKYSIDTGLLSPAVRVVMGLLFGTALIAGAEAAHRADHIVRDARVRQALAGAGIATLYAGVLVAANLYDLVGPVAAFIGMAATTLLAGALSLRFGAPSALLGLVGGLAAPALVGSGTPDVPLLSLYLALAVGGLCALSRTQRWMWLGVAALIGGFGWGLALILGGAIGIAASLSIGFYVLALAVALPLLAFGGDHGRIVRIAGSVVGCAQMAALVAVGGFAPLHWGLFALIAAATVWLSRREQRLADLPLASLGIALFLTLAWDRPNTTMLAIVLTGTAVIHGLPAILRLWRAKGRIGDAAQIAAIAAATLIVPATQFRLLHIDPILAALALLGASIAGIAAARGWSVANRRDDMRFALLVTTTALLLGAAAALALPGWIIAPAFALLAAATLLLGVRAQDPRLERSAWGLGTIALLVAVARGVDGNLLGHALGIQTAAAGITGMVEWVVPALVATLFALRTDCPRIAQPAAVLLGYVGTAQLMPLAGLALIPAALLAAIGRADRRALPAFATAAALSALWAVWPLGTWLGSGVRALFGTPMLVTALPGIADTATRIAAPALAFVLSRRTDWPERPRHIALFAGAAFGLIATHIAYKHLFGMAGAEAFIRHGMAERTVWELLLALAAFAAWRWSKPASRILAAAALVHFAWFTAILHNPLWSLQAVGGWPVANLLLPAYATAFALLWRIGAPTPIAARLRDGARMAIILLFAASSLRQIAHGALPVLGAVTQVEDIARSIVAILLAIGFLQWGIARRLRDWRIASLVLMLGAVAKVFLFDAAGLDGLLRIASFAALGFSLIGIGWLYSRYIPEAPLTPEARLPDSLPEIPE